MELFSSWLSILLAGAGAPPPDGPAPIQAISDRTDTVIAKIEATFPTSKIAAAITIAPEALPPLTSLFVALKVEVTRVLAFAT